MGAPNNPQRTRQQHRKQMDLAYMYKKVAKHLPFFTSLFFREKISQVSGIHPHAADPPSCIGQREGTYGVSLYHPSNLVRPRSLRSFQEVSLYRPILTSRECPSVIRGSDSLGEASRRFLCIAPYSLLESVPQSSEDRTRSEIVYLPSRDSIASHASPTL